MEFSFCRVNNTDLQFETYYEPIVIPPKFSLDCVPPTSCPALLKTLKAPALELRAQMRS